MELINVENVSFAYGSRKIMNGLSFKVYDGDFLSIVGPNGAGKSTLLKLMLGILAPDSGKITVEAGSNISYVSQKASSFNQDFPATVSEIVSLGLYGKKSKANKPAVVEALRKVGMEEYKHSLIGKLSGGQQQRLFIAKALVNEPRIIFLDEPTVGIDAGTVGSICCLLGDLNRRYGLTIIMVTHDIPSIINHSTKILNFSHDGKVELADAREYDKLFTHNT